MLWLIARRAGFPRAERPLFILLLAQGGEFAFVLLGLAARPGRHRRRRGAGDHAGGGDLDAAHAVPARAARPSRAALLRRAGEARAADVPQVNKVIVAGLGRVGQVVARMLHASGHEPTVLDDDPDHVEQSRKFGFRVFYGDATRLDLLHAAGADSADFLIITLDDPRRDHAPRADRAHALPAAARDRARA